MSYKDNLWSKLSKELPPNTRKGIYNGREYSHVLPLDGQKTQHDVIHEYLDIDIDPCLLPECEYHTHIHHLTSSQLLCYNVFSRLMSCGVTNENMVKLFENLNRNFDLGFHVALNQVCKFEYNDGLIWGKNINEGTKFDFHIAGDDNSQEIFIETKFTEPFGTANVKDGDYHPSKAEFYLNELAGIVCRIDNKALNIEDVYANYQIFRNVVRAKKHNSIVIFIYDGNCSDSTIGVKRFKSKFTINTPYRVEFLTWQDVKMCWPDNIVVPFQFKCF